MPIQTISFYNFREALKNYNYESCHAYPNDKLLQQVNGVELQAIFKVVMPIQTISFYNTENTLKLTTG